MGGFEEFLKRREAERAKQREAELALPDDAVSALRRSLRRRSAPPPPSTPSGRPNSGAPGTEPIRYVDLRRPEHQAEHAAAAASHSAPPRPLCERVVVLEQAVSGREVEMAGSGKAYLVEDRFGGDAVTPIARSADFPKGLEALGPGFGRLFCQSDSGMGCCLAREVPHLCDSPGLAPEDFLFLDLETTGLSNCPVFLIGTMVWEGGALIVRQFLARNYAEERAILSLFHEHAMPRKLLVTFNGKSFDFPFLRTRAAANGVRFTFTPAHVDLLHTSRRIWRGKLPDCKLQTLERHICGRMRYGDIPGHAIPEAYHAYVRTGNAAEIVEILKHNLLDLLTMADLLIRMPREA